MHLCATIDWKNILLIPHRLFTLWNETRLERAVLREYGKNVFFHLIVCTPRENFSPAMQKIEIKSINNRNNFYKFMIRLTPFHLPRHFADCSCNIVETPS
jgi:hypothetical protein